MHIKVLYVCFQDSVAKVGVEVHLSSPDLILRVEIGKRLRSSEECFEEPASHVSGCCWLRWLSSVEGDSFMVNSRA